MIDEKIDKIVELDISDDELDDELFEEMGVDIISLVDQPAIQTDFLYFNEEEHSSYSEEEKLAIVEFAENDENGIYITKDDLYMDMTLNKFAGIGDVVTAIRSLDILKKQGKWKTRFKK